MKTPAAFLAACLALAPPAYAASARLDSPFPGVTLERPTDLQDPRDGSGRLFAIEQTGRIKVFPNSPGARAETFLDLTGKVAFDGNEMGLLGLAFHPKFKKNGFFYVNYTASGPRRTVVERYRVSKDPARADASSGEVVLEIAQPYSNHNGGQTSFGPDGYLYVALGDGGSGGDPQGHAQNLGSMLGKILRIDVDRRDPGKAYAVPKDNPFAGVPGARGEIWAYGLRNPWRFSWDPKGRMWTGDVGQNKLEEINIVKKGGNYGWNVWEGDSCFRPDEGCPDEGMEGPVAVYGREMGVCVTGGFVYRGKRAPGLKGKYVFGDFVSGRIWAVAERGGVFSYELVMESGKQIASFGEDREGELYLCAFDGKIYRFEAP